jgi:DNA-binding LacI/PurR family transcriptional regulator
VGIIGMDNTPLSAVTNPPLTTIGYDVKVAAHLLITTTLAGIGEPVVGRPQLDPGFRLIQRETT